MILSQFQSVGRDLFARGLIASHSGNLSIRIGERLFITHRGSMLGSLEEQRSRGDRATLSEERASPVWLTERERDEDDTFHGETASCRSCAPVGDAPHR